MILHTLLDYDTLRLIWWGLLGLLLIAFAITGGSDLGVGMLLPFVARTDLERRVVINSIGATWEGNQVWLIVGAAALFAAWPPLYAVSFSGFYVAMFAALAALILRPVGFKYRSKHESVRWRAGWDAALFIGGFVPALIFGVALGNVLQGVPFRFDADLRVSYEGGIAGLLNPFGLLCGAVSVAMLAVHGAAWLALKTTGTVAMRARASGSAAALTTVALYALAGACLWWLVDGYRITSALDRLGPSNPLLKTVAIAPHAWFDNYLAHPALLAVPALGLLGALLAFAALRARREIAAWLASALSVACIVLSVGVSMFPFILPSSLDPNASLTAWDASSSHLTLFIMLVVTLVFVPLIVAYTSWAYHVLRGKVDADAIRDGSGHAY
ncbi:MAG: cytochrome d ubiquinol oxidase subunit II [Burkholderiaceae bacterium]